MFPNRPQLVSNATIPFDDKQDELQWKHSAIGDLQLREAYNFKQQ